MLSGCNTKIFSLVCLVLLTPSIYGEMRMPTGVEGSSTIENSPHKLQLNELIDEALKNNADFRSSIEETTIKDAEIGPRGAYEDPILGVEAMNFPVDSFRRDQYGMTGIQLSLTQKIPFPGKLSKLRNSAKYAHTAQDALASQKRLQVIRDVKVAYYELFLAYKKKEILGEQKKLVDQVLTVTRNNYSINKATQAEALNLQVEEANLMDQLLTAERAVKSKFGEINHLLGRANHEHYIYGEPETPPKSTFDFSTFTEAVVIQKALALNPSVSSKRSELSAADEKLSYARWNYLPDFEFKLGYTFRRPSPGDNGTDFVSGMVGVSLPIWAFEKQSEEKRGAEAQKNKAEALLSEERNMISHNVHETYAKLEESAERLKLFDGGVLPLVRQAVQSGKAAYLTGKIEYSTLLNLLNRRFQTENSYAEALVTYESKIAELQALIGEPLEDQ